MLLLDLITVEFGEEDSNVVKELVDPGDMNEGLVYCL